jgi:crossover junction endodeoxyribonuclease RuvC
MNRVVGIDPGLRLTGFAAVDIAEGAIEPTLVEGGVIRLDAKTSLEYRLAHLCADLGDLLDQLKPGSMAVEQLFAHYKHPRTAILMGHARGVILLCAKQRNIDIIHLPSTEVKKAITGHGHASKEQIQQAVQSQCNLAEPPNPPDVADAIAIALTAARRLAYENL